MKTTYHSTKEKGIARWVLVVLSITGASIIILILQGVRFSSSLWVVAEFGFIEWQEHITRMLNILVIWAIVAGIIFAGEAFAAATTTEVKKLLIIAAANFCVGFACTYFLVAILGIALYIPLGILSFIFPHEIAFTSLGFAFLCSSYIVFLWIATDTPSVLIGIIKKAPIYFKILGLLFAILLAVQALSAILSVLIILMKNSIWRIYLPAFIIAFGATLITTVLIYRVTNRKGVQTRKVMGITSVYVLSIVTGNISDGIFHWGEYASAVVAAFAGPPVYSLLINRIQRSPASALSVIVGSIGGLGAGLLIANLTKLNIVSQNWFGIICGSMIALGFGAAFGFMLSPRIGDLVIRVFRVRPIIGAFLSVGFIAGIMLGMVVGGLVNR